MRGVSILLLCLPLLADSVDPRGPVRTPGMPVTVRPGEVQAAGYRFANHTAKPGPWKTSWIWIEGPGKPMAAMFRKEVVLDAAPSNVAAWISADVHYRLYVNGTLASRGPDDIGNDFIRQNWTGVWLYDSRDLTPLFHKGRNVIAAEVFTAGFSTHSLGRPGLLFEADVRMPGAKRITVQSDAAWQVAASEAYSMGTVAKQPLLKFDANREPQGWRESGFNAAGWGKAKIVEGREPLAASEIPPRLEAIYPPLSGDAIPRRYTADATFRVRFDRVLSAYPSVKVRGGKGATLTILPNERNLPGTSNRATSVVLRDGISYYEFPRYDSFSVLNIELSNVTEPLEIEDVRAVFTSYPVSYRGTFESSDAELNRLWKSLRWSVQLCMQTHHLDSPHHQEPISDPGDYLIEAVANDYAFGEPWLARQDLRKFAWILRNNGYRNFHTSYALLWLQMLLDYYDYTGDAALVKELAPEVHGLLAQHTGYLGKNGLISEAPDYMFMDWVTVAGFPAHHPPAVIGQGYMTAFYYRALADAARVAAITGDRALPARYEGLRTTIVVAFERELWNAETGLYRDGKPFQTSVPPSQWLPADKAVETFTPQLNSLAVLYDLAPQDRRAAIMRKVMALEPLDVQPYFMHFVFGALDAAGLFPEFGVPQMHRWQIDPDSQTVREMWTSGDFSHGWGATPLIQMSRRILGVSPLKPGFSEILVQPQLGELTWARGTVPTPHGPVEIDCHKTAEGVAVKVKLPAGMSGEVRTAGKAQRVGPGETLVNPRTHRTI